MVGRKSFELWRLRDCQKLHLKWILTEEKCEEMSLKLYLAEQMSAGNVKGISNYMTHTPFLQQTHTPINL